MNEEKRNSDQLNLKTFLEADLLECTMEGKMRQCTNCGNLLCNASVNICPVCECDSWVPYTLEMWAEEAQLIDQS